MRACSHSWDLGEVLGFPVLAGPAHHLYTRPLSRSLYLSPPLRPLLGNSISILIKRALIPFTCGTFPLEPPVHAKQGMPQETLEVFLRRRKEDGFAG